MSPPNNSTLLSLGKYSSHFWPAIECVHLDNIVCLLFWPDNILYVYCFVYWNHHRLLQSADGTLVFKVINIFETREIYVFSIVFTAEMFHGLLMKKVHWRHWRQNAVTKNKTPTEKMLKITTKVPKLLYDKVLKITTKS